MARRKTSTGEKFGPERQAFHDDALAAIKSLFALHQAAWCLRKDREHGGLSGRCRAGLEDAIGGRVRDHRGRADHLLTLSDRFGKELLGVQGFVHPSGITTMTPATSAHGLVAIVIQDTAGLGLLGPDYGLSYEMGTPREPEDNGVPNSWIAGWMVEWERRIEQQVFKVIEGEVLRERERWSEWLARGRKRAYAISTDAVVIKLEEYYKENEDRAREIIKKRGSQDENVSVAAKAEWEQEFGPVRVADRFGCSRYQVCQVELYQKLKLKFDARMWEVGE